MLKLKHSFLALAIFVMAGLVLSGNAHANPVCGTLEECRTLRSYLQEHLVNQESQVVRDFLKSQLTQVDARIEELLTGQRGSERRTTTTGAVFTRDRSHAALNEAWRDPDGLIWGDIVKNEDGSVREMVHSSQYMKEIGRPLPRPLPNGTLGAKEYCESIGARLPSKKEFTRLGGYLGSGSDQGYSHHDDQILPNLSDHWFWSSLVYPYDTDLVYVFVGSNGNVDGHSCTLNGAVRCVVSR